MKKVKVSELRVGDIFYHKGCYSTVTETYDGFVYCKCFMAPSRTKVLIEGILYPLGMGIGSYFILRNKIEVYLCERFLL